MIIKREDIINASYYFPIDYEEFLQIANKSNKRFYAYNGRVFDKERKYKDLDYKKSICEIEETDGDGFDYKINTIIISGFFGIGKTHFVKENQDLLTLDLYSSKFDLLNDTQDSISSEDIENYISIIKDRIGKVDIILVHSDKLVRKALEDNNLDYCLIYPIRELKEEYIDRYIRLGINYKCIKKIETNWDQWVEELELEKFPFKIKLLSNQYLEDVFKSHDYFKEKE